MLNEDLVNRIIRMHSTCNFCGVSGIHKHYNFSNVFGRHYNGYICDKCSTFPEFFEDTEESILKHFRIKESPVKDKFVEKRGFLWRLELEENNVYLSKLKSRHCFIVLYEEMKNGYSDFKYVRSDNTKIFDAHITFYVNKSTDKQT